MQKKTKSPADKKLIISTFGFEPLDWARYPDGTLSIIKPSGQKIQCTPSQLEEFQASKKAAAAAKSKPKPKSKTKPAAGGAGK